MFQIPSTCVENDFFTILKPFEVKISSKNGKNVDFSRRTEIGFDKFFMPKKVACIGL